MKINENLTLAERAKAAIVAKIVKGGFIREDESSRIRLSDVPYYLKWATGYGGIWLVGETEQGEEFFYTPAAWDGLTDEQRDILRPRAAGMLFRAFGHEFVIALQDCPDSHAWCPELDESGVPAQVEISNKSGINMANIDFDGAGNTEEMLKVECPAAIAAVNLKDEGIHGAGLADWYLPAYGQWSLIFMYRNKINAAIKTFLGAVSYLSQAVYWTSTPSGTTSAWVLSNPSLTSYTTGGDTRTRTEKCKVRACSQYKCTKRYMTYGED